MPLRFECVLPVVMMFAIWNCHFHKPGPHLHKAEFNALAFHLQSSDSPLD